MSQNRHASQRSMKWGTRAPTLPAGESQVCRMELLEPRLLLSAIVSVDAGLDQTVSEGDTVYFAGSYEAGTPTPGAGWLTTQLTDNTVNAGSQDIDGSRVVWVQAGDVYYSPDPWAPAESRVVAQLTTSGKATGPQIQGDYIVWHDEDAQVQQGITLYNIITQERSDIVPFADFTTLDNPVMSGNRIVWTQSATGEPKTVWCYDIDTGHSAAVQPEGLGAGGDQWNPQISGDNVIWRAPGTGGNRDIFTKNLVTGAVLNVSNSAEEDQDARISGNSIVWQAPVGPGGPTQVFQYNFGPGAVAHPLSDGVHSVSSPRISGQYVAWLQRNADDTSNDVWLYDGTSAQNITNNSWDDTSVDISGSNVVWAGQTGSGTDYEAFFYDALTAETTQITGNTYDDIIPLVSGRDIAWTGQVDGSGQNHEIFFAKDQSTVAYTYDWSFGDGARVSGTLTPDHVYAANGDYAAVLTVIASDGSQMSDSLNVSVTSVGPKAEILGAPPTSQIGVEITLTANVRDPGPMNAFTYSWAIVKDGEEPLMGTDRTISFTPDSSGTYLVLLAVGDQYSDWSDFTLTEINVQNVAATVSIAGPATGDEGAPITLTANVPQPGPNDTFAYAWTIARGGEVYAQSIDPTDPTFTFTPDDNGTYVVALAVTDNNIDFGVAETEIDVQNVAPTAAIAGPATSNEGSPVMLTANVSDPGIADTFSYLWTVTKNGAAYATGTGASLTFTPDDNGAYAASLSVTDKDGGVGSASAEIDVLNVAPTVTAIAGPSVGVRGQAVSFAASYTDPGTLDTQTVAWQVVDAGGTVVAAGTGTAIGFTPANLGTYQVNVEVTDNDGGVGRGSAAVRVDAAGILADPVDGLPALFVGASPNGDKIDVKPGSQAGTVAVYIDGQLVNTFAGQSLARIVIYGGAGNDNIKLAPNLPPIPAELYGGAGDDKLAGGPGNDIIVGGAGNDLLWGDGGNDLLIGGAGTDKLMGGKGDDVLVGSSFSGENNRTALRAIMAEWARTDISYVLRCLHLTYGGGLNGDWVLDETTITDDNLRDKVFGEQGQDYFLIGLEDATDWNFFSELLTVVEANFIFTI